MLRIVIDVNIIFKMLVTIEPDIEADEAFKAFRCIRYNKDKMKIILSGNIIVAYESFFKKIGNGYFLYKSGFTLPLEANKQLEYVNPEIAPCTINDPDDQIYLDCAYSGKADYILSNDSDFKQFDLGECKFKCYNTHEFLEELCSEYL